MPLEKAKSYIRQASEIESFASISITGGEPFLYYEDLLEIIKTANSYMFNVTCGTNGFWAKTEEIAGQKLDELINAGLNHMSISVDEFHSVYVPIENIRNIVRATKNRRITVGLTCIATQNSMRLKDITKALGEDIVGYSIIEAPCLPIGNALDKIDQSEFIYENDLSSNKCFSENALTIMPDGSAYPCLLTPAFYLGSLNELPIREIMEKFYQNTYCGILEKYGYEWYVKIIKDNNLPISLKDKYVNLCDACNTLFKKEEYLSQYKTFTEMELDNL
jgi:MoaA/NifB/PqqE/SkfB family radical SAM enzyme